MYIAHTDTYFSQIGMRYFRTGTLNVTLLIVFTSDRCVQNPPDKTPPDNPPPPPPGQPPRTKLPDKTPGQNPRTKPPDKTPGQPPPLDKTPYPHKIPYKTPRTQTTMAKSLRTNPRSQTKHHEDKNREKSRMTFILISDDFRALLLMI